MKVVGIVAEYNPFHCGHAYHLREAKRRAGADFAVVVMSPDFVQRGEPALFDKYTRTKMALLNGADLVLELPVCYAAGSAEYFAQGAVSLLGGLGVADVLSFGCEGAAKDMKMEWKKSAQPRLETGVEKTEAALFWQIAGILNREPESFKKNLCTQLAEGVGFPRARAAALLKYLKDKGAGTELSEQFLKLPNNILGIEYCRAILKFCPQMEILPVMRVGSGYHEEQIKGEFCSASAIRKTLQVFPGISPALERYIPENLRDLYAVSRTQMITPDDLLPCLVQKLLFSEKFDDILDITKDLSDRICSLRFKGIGKTYEELTEFLAAKQTTKAHVRRALLHLILGIDAAQTERFRKNGPAHYARVLGFYRKSSSLLHEIKLRGTLLLVTKNADAAGYLDDMGRAMLRQDFAASHLYRGIQSIKYGTPFRSEYEMSPVIVNS